MTTRYVPEHKPPESQDEPALWFAFRNAELLVCESEGAPSLPCCVRITEHGIEPQRSHYLGRYDGQHSYAVAIPESQGLPEGWRPIGLRDALAAFDVELRQFDEHLPRCRLIKPGDEAIEPGRFGLSGQRVVPSRRKGVDSLGKNIPRRLAAYRRLADRARMGVAGAHAMMCRKKMPANP